MINSVLEICEMAKSIERTSFFPFYDWTYNEAYKGRKSYPNIGCSFSPKYTWIHLEYDDEMKENATQRYQDMIDWCNENCLGYFGVGHKAVRPTGIDASVGFIFEFIDDAFAFRMRWA